MNADVTKMTFGLPKVIHNCKVKIYSDPRFPLPQYQSSGAAGVDLYAALEKPQIIEPHEILAIKTGVYLELPEGYEAQIRARSGLALKHGLSLVNGIGTIDSDYRGEISVILINLKNEAYEIQPGDRIAQMIITNYAQASFISVDSPESLSKTQRGEGGFGHSGK